MVFAAIMAGGSGTRMGLTDVPKQFMMLGDEPIIIRTIQAFALSGSVDRIVVMCPDAWVNYTKDLVSKHLFMYSAIIHIASGGKTRNETLEKSVDYICRNFGADEKHIILTHDAVRPFVTTDMINDNIKAAGEYGACNTVVGATDTITVSRDGKFIDETPERATMFHSQTPQSFTLGAYNEAVNSLEKEKRNLLTDACSLFTTTGRRVFMVTGSEENIKITRPSDITTAQAIIKSRVQ